jgi:hypothetical protein
LESRGPELDKNLSGCYKLIKLPHPSKEPGMRCPHLAKDVIYNCTSGELSEAPGGRCLRKYCKSELYLACPRFVAAAESARSFGFFRMSA